MILGCSLILYVCVLSDEFGPRREKDNPSLMSSDNIRISPQSFQVKYFMNGPIRLKFGSNIYYLAFQNGRGMVVTAQYSYGWSFFLAVMGFLGAEMSAVLCLSAFLNRFSSEVSLDFYCIIKYHSPTLAISHRMNLSK